MSQGLVCLSEEARAQRNWSISVVLSDSTAMACELLATALKRVRTLKLLKCATTTEEVCKAVCELRPDVGIVNVHLADGPYSGFKALKQMQSWPISTKLVMLMEQTERELVVDAFRAGARGVFKKSAPLSLLFKCISAVHHGQIWASTEELQHLLEALQSAMPLRCVNSKGQALLSKREQEIVPVVAAGFTNKEISDKLQLSEHTVKNHLFRIYEKLGISSRVELILYAVTQRDDVA